MKRVIKNSFLLLALLGVMFTSCKKDYPEPPIQVLPIGTVYSIDDILNMESGTVFTQDASVYGIVTADEQSGNLYKAAFIQDRASGKAIELYLNATSGVRIGDSIRVYLKDVTYTEYNGLPQLSDFEADGHIVILANNRPIEPEETTIANIVAGNHLAGLVKLKNVMFTEKNTFAEPNTYGNRTLVDPSDFSKSVIVRTSNYANFAKDSLPQGTGNVTCIASLYGSTWQLLIRSASELEFDGYTPGPGGGSSLPYYQDFASSFGTYTTYDAAGAQSWEIDYNTAKMTGYVGGNNYANEDWLISAPVSLEGVSQVTMTMTYIARYFSNLNEDITILVSPDYTTGDPNQATWTPVSASLVEGSNWTDFISANIDLSQFIGQRVVVAVRYRSNDTKAGTIEVQSILIQEGGGVNPPPGPNPGGEVQSIPYTQSFATEFGSYMTYDVLGAQSWMIDYSTAKMTGHTGGNPGENFDNEDWLISSPVDLSGVSAAKMTMSYIGRYFTNISEEVTIWASTNYTWGSDPTTATWTRVPATLREGTNWNDFLTAEIALVNASGQQLAGQTVTFAVKYTSTNQKAGTMEIQSITIEEGNGGTPPTPPPTGGELQDMPYTQSFATEFGSYTTYDVSGPQSWMIDYSTAKMTGYSGGSHANEDWLLSSPVAVTGVSHAKVSVTYSAQYQNSDANDVTLQVSSDYVFGNAPSSANWTTMSTTYPNTSSFNDFKTVETSLDEFIGQNVTVAIRYTSTDAQSRTIEIQSITVQEGEAGGGTPPTPPPGPGTGSGTQNDPYNVVSGINLQGQNVTAWVQGYIVGSVKDGNNSVSSNDQINWSAPFDLKTNVLIADDPTCHEITNCVIVNLPNNKPLRTEVNLVDHPDNLGKQLTVLGTLRTYFGQAGLRDSNGTENDFILEGGGTPPTPPPTGEVQSLPYIQSFASDFGTYTTYDVSGPQSWMIDYSTAKMTGFINNNGQYEYYANEDWLISSPFEVPIGSFMLLSMTVECLGRYFDDINNEVTFWVTSGYEFGTDPTQINWIQLPCTLNEASSWDDFQTVTVDLSIIGQLMSETATIAVKYTSTDQVAGTIEIKKITIE